jgi:two-component system NtrC family sensor kinase
MYDLTQFTLADMVQCGQDLRRMGGVSKDISAVAGEIVAYLYDHLLDSESGRRSTVLVRLLKTQPFGTLSPELCSFAQALMPSTQLAVETKCLTLLASAGDEPQWKSPRDSRRHRAIPLPSEAALDEVPMIAQLLDQLGLKLSDLTDARREIIKDLDQRTFNVFHVPVARNSPFIPAQEEFVVPYGVESVLGSGGVLPDANLFAVILFARVPIPSSTASMFRTIALNVKMAMLTARHGHAGVA